MSHIEDAKKHPVISKWDSEKVFFRGVIVAIVLALIFVVRSAFHGSGAKSGNSSTGAQSPSTFVVNESTAQYNLGANEERFTVPGGAGANYTICSNKEFVAISYGMDSLPETNYDIKPGCTFWHGADPAGPIHVRALEDGTIIRFTRAR